MSAPVGPADQPAKPRFNRWLATGLIVSAAINLAFIGWGAARYIHHSRMAERSPSGQIEEQITRRMPDPAAAAFRSAFEKNARVPRGAFLRFRLEIADAIAADPYDRTKLAALLDQHRHRLDMFQESIQSGLLAAVDAMTPDERQQYARIMLRHGGPGAPRRHDGDGPPPPPLPPPPK